MKLQISKITEYIIVSTSLIWLVILAFNEPKLMEFENPYFNDSFQKAETVNYLFRTAIFILLSIFFVWRLIKPNKTLRIFCLFVFIILLIFTILDLAGILDYTQIIMIKR